MNNPHTTQQWGDSLPNQVLHENPPVVQGDRLADGRIQCGGCGHTQADNRLPGLMPSCNSCWSAIAVRSATC